MRRCATTLEAEMTVAEHSLLRKVLSEQNGTGSYLEIGTAAGGTLCMMLEALPAASRDRFVVVDPMKYFPDQPNLVRRNLQEHGFDPDLVDFRMMTSDEAIGAAEQQREAFDFMLIDGCHKIRSVTIDLKWTRLLSVGGCVAFHDYTPKHRGVWLAVNRFLASHRNYTVVDQADSLLVVRKTTASRRPEVSASDEWYAKAWYLPLQIERKWHKFRRAA